MASKKMTDQEVAWEKLVDDTALQQQREDEIKARLVALQSIPETVARQHESAAAINRQIEELLAIELSEAEFGRALGTARYAVAVAIKQLKEMHRKRLQFEHWCRQASDGESLPVKISPDIQAWADKYGVTSEAVIELEQIIKAQLAAQRSRHREIYD